MLITNLTVKNILYYTRIALFPFRLGKRTLVEMTSTALISLSGAKLSTTIRLAHILNFLISKRKRNSYNLLVDIRAKIAGMHLPMIDIARILKAAPKATCQTKMLRKAE
jgi:hypothetical protein